MSSETWKSPDGKIRKELIKSGIWGTKPTDLCECHTLITDYPILGTAQHQYSCIISDLDGDLGRILDVCLKTMNTEEVSRFTATTTTNETSFTIELVSFKSRGLIYEWTADEKYEIASMHKTKGVELFHKENRNKDAAHRFAKALKILCSIPIDVVASSEIDDGLAARRKQIDEMKGILYGNLSSCYLKGQNWMGVIQLCEKVLSSYDKDSVKTHYKLAVAYLNERNYVDAERSFVKVLEYEPDNKAAIEQLKSVRSELSRADQKYNLIVKKMFE